MSSAIEEKYSESPPWYTIAIHDSCEATQLLRKAWCVSNNCDVSFISDRCNVCALKCANDAKEWKISAGTWGWHGSSCIKCLLSSLSSSCMIICLLYRHHNSPLYQRVIHVEHGDCNKKHWRVIRVEHVDCKLCSTAPDAGRLQVNMVAGAIS